MAENNENIKITVVEKRGKRGCDYGHRVGDIYDYEENVGVTMVTALVIFMIMPRTQEGCAPGC